MTSSPSDTEAAEAPEESEAAEAPEEEVEEVHPLAEYAQKVAEAVGGEAVITFDTIKVLVDPDRWVETLTIARDELDLVCFSFLSAIDWSNDVAVGDPLEEKLEGESYELLAAVGDVSEGRQVVFSTRLAPEQPSIASLVDVYVGANWHERETHEMFGIDFAGHPDLSHLYLPETFIGNPLRKSFPLLSREVKPWPGKVDVEPMPEEEEEEAEGEGEAPDEADEGGGGEEGS